MLWAFRSSSPCLWKCYGALWAEEQLSGVNWQSACAPVHNHLSLAWDPLTCLKKMSDTFAKEPHDVSLRQGKTRDCNSSFKRQGPVILQRKTIRSEVLFVPPVRRWREVVKQMAIWVKYSQKWIKLYNIFTPTARHNDRLYLVSTTEYRTLEQQKYLTSHLWWLSSWAKLNVLSLLDQKPLRINGWVKSAFVFYFLVFFFLMHIFLSITTAKCLSFSLSLGLSSSSCLFTHTPLCWTLFWLSPPRECAGYGLSSPSSSEKLAFRLIVRAVYRDPY